MKQWREPWKNETINMGDINVYPGECLTVWMNHASRSGERDAKQIELRVTEDGGIQIFGDTKKLVLVDWAEWTSDPSEPRP